MYNTCTIFVRLQLYIYCTSIVQILYNDQCWSGFNPVEEAGGTKNVQKKGKKKFFRCRRLFIFVCKKSESNVNVKSSEKLSSDEF